MSSPSDQTCSSTEHEHCYLQSHVTMFSRREIGFYTHIYQNFNFKLCVIMVLAPTRHPRNGFSRELENYQGGSCPQLLAKFSINTQRKILLRIGLGAAFPPVKFSSSREKPLRGCRVGARTITTHSLKLKF